MAEQRNVASATVKIRKLYPKTLHELREYWISPKLKFHIIAKIMKREDKQLFWWDSRATEKGNQINND